MFFFILHNFHFLFNTIFCFVFKESWISKVFYFTKKKRAYNQSFKFSSKHIRDGKVDITMKTNESSSYFKYRIKTNKRSQWQKNESGTIETTFEKN